MLNLLHQTLKDDGILHIVTDVNDYAKYCRELLNQDEHLSKWCLLHDMEYSPTKGPKERAITLYERKAIDKEHQIYDIMYKKV